MSLPDSPPPLQQNALRSRLADWLARYGPAEVAGTVTAVLGSYLVHAATANEVAAAYGGAIGENIGFYGVILLFGARSRRRPLLDRRWHRSWRPLDSRNGRQSDY